MIGIVAEVAELRKLVHDITRFHTKILDRKDLHTKMRNYQRKRWLENLYSEGTVYGPWASLSDFTNIIRRERGIQPGRPILYQMHTGGRPNRIKNMSGYLRRQKNPRGGGGGLLHAWVETNILSDQFLENGTTSSTLWKFKATGGHDGSYAVFHDVGYTTGAGSLFPNFGVPARRIFSGGGGDADDADQYKADTEAYIDRIIRATGL